MDPIKQMTHEENKDKTHKHQHRILKSCLDRSYKVIIG
jgi:hypothetical protein